MHFKHVLIYVMLMSLQQYMINGQNVKHLLYEFVIVKKNCILLIKDIYE